MPSCAPEHALAGCYSGTKQMTDTLAIQPLTQESFAPFGQVLETDARHMLAQTGIEFHAAEQAAAAQIEIEQAENAPLGQASGEFLQFVELAGKVAAADQRADRSAGDHRYFDAGLVKRAQHANMGPASC